MVDVDPDGRKDLLVGDAEGEIILHANVNTKDDPRFDGGTPLEAGPPGMKVVINVGQRPTPEVVGGDNDGVPDLLVGSADGLVRLYRGREERWRAREFTSSGWSPVRGSR